MDGFDYAGVERSQHDENLLHMFMWQRHQGEIKELARLLSLFN
jgi:hypothetical protein